MTKSKKAEQAPEQENIPLRTFENFDKFNRKPFADQLTKVITTFHSFYKEAFVLSLNAKYGSGKTAFLEMWKNDLKNQYKVIHINAWETDFDDEPIIPIVSALLDNISEKDTNQFKSALIGVLGATALAGDNVIEHYTGSSIKEIVEAVKSKPDLQTVGENLYTSYSFKKKAYKTLKDNLSEYISKLQNKPLIIFVDELDRVRPDYSVKFLEAIKHIFSVRGICFVIAVDRGQLECSIKQLYGDIVFEDYYRRFITREAELSEATEVDLLPFLKFQAEDFFDEKRATGIKFPFKPQEQNYILELISVYCKIFNFVPREIETFFRIFSQFMAVSSDDLAHKYWIEAAIFLICVFIKDRNFYKRIGTSKVTPDELKKFIKNSNFKHFENNNIERKIILNAMAFAAREDNPDLLNQIISICLEYKFPGNNETQRDEVVSILMRSVNAYGEVPRRPYFEEIYKNIEEWRSLIE